MSDKDQRNDPYEKKLAEIIVEDRERAEKDREHMKKLRVSLGCTFVILAGVVAGGAFAGRQLMEHYGVGRYAVEESKEGADAQKAEAKSKPDESMPKEEEKTADQDKSESEGLGEESAEEDQEKEEKQDIKKDKKKAVEPISYDKKKKILSFSVNGSGFTFPVKSKEKK